jgi:hypothetical protein
VQNYDGGPQFAEVVAAKWPVMFAWGPPTTPIKTEGKDWVLTFGNGSQMRWPVGGSDPTILAK